MSAALFYILAALLTLAAVAAVVAPTARQVALAVAALDVLVGILLVSAGAYLLGAITVVAPAGALLALATVLRRAGYRGLLDAPPGRLAVWPAAAAVCGGLGVVLLWTTATRVEDAAGSSPAGQGLLAVLHYRTPVTLAVAVVLAALALGGALMIGRFGQDERLLDRALEQRRLREERTVMRRRHRAAARAQRDGGSTP